MKYKSYNILIILSVIFVFFSLNSQYAFVEFPEKIYFKYVPYILIAQIFYWFMVALTWKITVLGSTAISIPLAPCFKQCISIIIGKYIPGKIWGIFARSTQLKNYNINYQDSIGLSYLELIFGLHAGLTLSLFCLGIAKTNIIFIIFSILSLLPIVLITKANKTFFNLIEKIIDRSLNKKLYFSTFSFRPKTYVTILFFYFIDWIFLALILIPIYLVIFGHTPDLSIVFLLLTAQTTSIIIGFFAFFIPGGIGVREGAFSVIMSMVMPLQDAILLSILYRLWNTFADISLGLLFFIIPDN